MFYAPHVVRMSSVLGTRFEPLRYTLDGSRLYSNVYYRCGITLHFLSQAAWHKPSCRLIRTYMTSLDGNVHDGCRRPTPCRLPAAAVSFEYCRCVESEISTI